MIKNVIFDFGDVIARFDPDKMMEVFQERKEYQQELKRAFFEGGLWERLDDGSLEYSEYARQVKEKLRPELQESADKFLEGWYRAMPYREGVPELIQELKEKGYGLYILSNAAAFFAEKSSYFEVTKVFRGKVFSGCVKMVKPNPEIYRYLLDTYGLTAEECLFLDDRAVNIAAAREQGIQGLVFDGNVQAVRDYLKSQGRFG